MSFKKIRDLDTYTDAVPFNTADWLAVADASGNTTRKISAADLVNAVAPSSPLTNLTANTARFESSTQDSYLVVDGVNMGYMELRGAHACYIDLTSSETSNDYDLRLISSHETAATDNMHVGHYSWNRIEAAGSLGLCAGSSATIAGSAPLNEMVTVRTYSTIFHAGSGVEGAQIYLALPDTDPEHLKQDTEGNAWNLDVFKDATGAYGVKDNSYMRIFSPVGRNGGIFNPILFTPRQGIFTNGLNTKNFVNLTYARSSASKGDAFLGPNFATDIIEGQSFSITGINSGGLTSVGENAGSNGGIEFKTKRDANGNLVNGTYNTGHIFLDSVGTFHFTMPNMTTTGIATLNRVGQWNTISGGTSDSRFKDDIESLSEAETRVGNKIKANMKKFRIVAKDVTDGKIRVGAIAQEIEQFFTEEGLDYKDYSIIYTEKKYALFENGKISAVESEMDLSNTDPEQHLSNTKIVLKNGTEYTGKVTSWFCQEECADFEENGGTKEDYINKKVLVQTSDGSHIVLREDIASRKRLPREGWEEIDLFRIDYDQLLAFVVAAL